MPNKSRRSCSDLSRSLLVEGADKTALFKADFAAPIEHHEMLGQLCLRPIGVAPALSVSTWKAVNCMAIFRFKSSKNIVESLHIRDVGIPRGGAVRRQRGIAGENVRQMLKCPVAINE